MEITVADKEIEFLFQMVRKRPPMPEGAEAAPSGRGRRGRGPAGPPAPLDVKRKFKLKEMIYNGQLDLKSPHQFVIEPSGRRFNGIGAWGSVTSSTSSAWLGSNSIPKPGRSTG